MNELALFTGVGGGILGGRLLGWRTVCAVEIDPFCREVLLRRQLDGCLPRFPIWDDVRTFDGNEWKGKVDIVTGGFPCQDISAAGQGRGITGERSGLVFEMLRIVDEVRPAFVFAENSPQLRTKGLATIVERFISMGYVGRVGVLGAGDIGANHERKRMWIVAVAKGFRRRPGRERGFAPGVERQQQLPFQITDVAEPEGQQMGAGGQPRGHLSVGCIGGNVTYSDGFRGLQSQGRVFEIGQWFGHCVEQPSYTNGEVIRQQSGRGSGANGQGAPVAGITDWWSVPRFAGVDDGMASRMDRVKATGNGQVAGVAALVWSVLTSDLWPVNPLGTV